MKLVAKCDVEVPVAFVYRAVTDFEAWEQTALKRGAEVTRTGAKPNAVGAGWRVRFTYRGKSRNALIKVARLVADQLADFTVDSPSVDASSQIEVTALSPRRTRIRVVFAVTPKTIAARVFIGTLRLSKKKVMRRFETRVAQLGMAVTDRYQRSLLAGAKV